MSAVYSISFPATGPMVVSEGNGHVGCVNSAEVVLGQAAGIESP
jgi:hypothetical protein